MQRSIVVENEPFTVRQGNHADTLRVCNGDRHAVVEYSDLFGGYIAQFEGLITFAPSLDAAVKASARMILTAPYDSNRPMNQPVAAAIRGYLNAGYS